MKSLFALLEETQAVQIEQLSKIKALEVENLSLKEAIAGGAPPPPVLELVVDPVPAEVKLSYLEFFMERFTEKEILVIEEACEPIIPENRELRVAMKFMYKASYITPTDPKTIRFVTLLEKAGLIAPGRATEILQ